MINRHLPDSMKGPVLSRFCVLLLGQGFTRREFQGVRQQVWKLLKGRCAVFANVDQPGLPEAGSLAIFYDSGASLDLGITQSGRTLTMSPTGHAVLRAFLATETVKNDSGETLKANEVWASGGRRGATGAVVLVVVKGTTAGDLYELTPSEEDRTPIAGAVLVQTEHWINVLARAMGQMIASLADEYSLSDADHDKTPELMFGPFPNLVRVTDLEKLALARGDKPTEAIRCFGPAWEKFPLATFKYHPFAGQTDQGMGLYEGGNTFRQNVLRSNFDCLMKRIPFESGTKTIQNDVRFCPVCQEALHLALGRLRDFEPARMRKRQGTQRLEYDMINWATEKVEPLPVINRDIPSTSPHGPKWKFKLSASSGVGLQLTDVNLEDRPGDPFVLAKEAFKVIEFTDLKVKFKGEPETALAFANPFANTIDKPRLFIAGPGVGGLFQHGLKLNLTWSFQNKYLIDVTLSVVLRGERNDFDPGGTAAACKVFPQISMRYRPRTKGYAKSTANLPPVEYLTGTIRIEANNIIPKDIVIPPGLPPGEETFLKNHMAVGTLRAAYVTDSNTSHLDSFYLDSASIATFAVDKRPPWFFLYRGQWQSGRKLAHVSRFSFAGDTWDIGAGTARYGFVKHRGPLLPNWSWLFDYIDTNVSAKKTIVGAYTSKERRFLRSALVDWPPVADVDDGNLYQMRVDKQPRQGAYDNIHMHPEMLEHEAPREHQPLITAPFCAEKCLHLHWRWGISGINSLATPYDFLGWDNVGSSAAAHAGRGMPLIPPNQHLDVTVDPMGPDPETGKPTRIVVSYAVRADAPQATEQQVFLEQGLGFAYRYAIGSACAPSIDDFSLLMAAVGALPPEPSDDEIEEQELRLNNAKSNGPLYDAYLREDFHKIYSKIRFYDKERDKVKSDNVQQVPAGSMPVLAQQPPGAPKQPLDLEKL